MTTGFGSHLLSSRTCFGISVLSLENLGFKAPPCGRGSLLIVLPLLLGCAENEIIKPTFSYEDGESSSQIQMGSLLLYFSPFVFLLPLLSCSQVMHRIVNDRCQEDKKEKLGKK